MTFKELEYKVGFTIRIYGKNLKDYRVSYNNILKSNPTREIIITYIQNILKRKINMYCNKDDGQYYLKIELEYNYNKKVIISYKKVLELLYEDILGNTLKTKINDLEKEIKNEK